MLLTEVVWNTCQEFILNCSHTQPRVKLTPRKPERGSRGRRAQQTITSYASVTTSRGPKRKTNDSKTVSYCTLFEVKVSLIPRFYLAAVRYALGTRLG